MQAEDIQTVLADVAIVRRIYFFPEIESTSDAAKRLLEKAGSAGELHGTLLIADHQTAGRGRHQRQWLAPAGKALLMSLIVSARHTAALPMATPVGVCEAVRRIAAVEALLKYPNDVLVNGRKLGGILLEQARCGNAEHVIVGIGVNCNQRAAELPPATRIPATSIYIESGVEVNIPALAAAILQELESYIQPGAEQRLQSRMNCLCTTIGKIVEIRTQTGEVAGTAMAITADGALVVRTEGGTQRLVYSGDVRQLTMDHASHA